MAIPDYHVRIVANACIARYDAGEGDIHTILNSYSRLTEEDKVLILARIAEIRPDITQ